MTAYLVRAIKRLLVFLSGVAVIYLAVWKFFPFFDHRIPVALALLATYVFTAYIFIPASIRFFRLFVRPAHIPHYCVTPDGFASDPLNIGLIGTRVEIIEAMKKAGWYKADKKTLRTGLKLMFSIAFGRQYPNAPFSTLFVFGRQQDLGFQKPIKDSSSNRHHVRFWACQLGGPDDFSDHLHFWQRIQSLHNITDNRQFWVGAASKDIGVIPVRHNAQITHMIAPDTNAERDLIVTDLKKSGYLEKTQVAKISDPYELRNRALGGFLQSDGKMTICVLKD